VAASGSSAGGPAAAEPWQIRLYRHSIKKKETLGAVLRLLPPVAGRRCLEIGCSTGTSSWFLRRRGGDWTLTDFDAAQAASARRLLDADVTLIDGGGLPFPDGSFDVAVGINFLEHLEDDAGFVRDVARVLVPGGAFVATCHEDAPRRPGHRLKRLYGLTAGGAYDLARDGYARGGLERLIAGAGLAVERLESYSGLFTEVVENSLNFAYNRTAARTRAAGNGGGDGGGRFHGDAAPDSEAAFASVGWRYRAYEAAYPALRGVSLLDRLLPFGRGYMFCVRARKPAPVR
jgi:SAM-dependent methyltransferase